MIVDVHCHAWPDNIAEAALTGRVSQLPRRGDGKISSLRGVLKTAGVDQGVILGVADSAKTVHGVNRFVGRTIAAGYIGFGTISPDLSVEENLQSLRDNNIKGVKLHTLFQGFRLDDKRIYDILEGFGSDITVISHVGAGGGNGGAEDLAGSPKMMKDIITTFPELKMVACHFGGYHMLDEAEAELLGTSIYLETSWPPTMASLAPERVKNIISKHGADRIVFGSDWPMAKPEEEIAAIRALNLSDEATEGILGGNFLRLYGDPNVTPLADEEATS
jgi:predicted TIM-barrel fold metal-dependent hydrolase